MSNPEGGQPLYRPDGMYQDEPETTQEPPPQSHPAAEPIYKQDPLYDHDDQNIQKVTPPDTKHKAADITQTIIELAHSGLSREATTAIVEALAQSPQPRWTPKDISQWFQDAQAWEIAELVKQLQELHCPISLSVKF